MESGISQVALPKSRCHSDVGEAHPDQWLVVEAVEAHSDRRFFDRIAVVDACSDSRATMKYGEARKHEQDRAALGWG